jgi:hypothetical protein
MRLRVVSSLLIPVDVSEAWKAKQKEGRTRSSTSLSALRK